MIKKTTMKVWSNKQIWKYDQMNKYEIMIKWTNIKLWSNEQIWNYEQMNKYEIMIIWINSLLVKDFSWWDDILFRNYSYLCNNLSLLVADKKI